MNKSPNSKVKRKLAMINSSLFKTTPKLKKITSKFLMANLKKEWKRNRIRIMQLLVLVTRSNNKLLFTIKLLEKKLRWMIWPTCRITKSIIWLRLRSCLKMLMKCNKISEMSLKLNKNHLIKLSKILKKPMRMLTKQATSLKKQTKN